MPVRGQRPVRLRVLIAIGYVALFVAMIVCLWFIADSFDEGS
jgi:hypothetical protein